MFNLAPQKETVYIAFKGTLPNNATFWHKISSLVIMARLVSKVHHGGVAVGSKMYHATFSGGVRIDEFDSRKWQLVATNLDSDLVKHRMASEVGKKYSLLPFFFPFLKSKKTRYCFELQAALLFGEACGMESPATIMTNKQIASVAFK